MDALRRLTEVVDGGGRCVLATVIGVHGSAPRGPGARLLLEPDGRRTGSVGGGEAEQEALSAAAEMLRSGGEAVRQLEIDSRCGGALTVLLERFGAASRLVVVGAGHVGGAVASLAATTGFAVTVLDRAGATEPTGAKLLTGDPTQLLAAVPEPSWAQVVVATGSHDLDVALAVAALGRGFAGVGVLGSRLKAAGVRRAAEAAGLAEAAAVLRCPVGLDLGAVTPAEIAVAVVAELVTLARRGEVPASWRKPPA